MIDIIHSLSFVLMKILRLGINEENMHSLQPAFGVIFCKDRVKYSGLLLLKSTRRWQKYSRWARYFANLRYCIHHGWFRNKGFGSCKRFANIIVMFCFRQHCRKESICIVNKYNVWSIWSSRSTFNTSVGLGLLDRYLTLILTYWVSVCFNFLVVYLISFNDIYIGQWIFL